MDTAFLLLLIIVPPLLLIGGIAYVSRLIQVRWRRHRGVTDPLAAYAKAPRWENSWEVAAVYGAVLVIIALPFLILMWTDARDIESEASLWIYLISAIALLVSARRIAVFMIGRRVAMRGRDYWLAIHPEKQPESLAEFPNVFSVLVDWSKDGTDHAVAALADGTASLYTSRGITLVGHLPRSDDAVKQLLRLAEQTLQERKGAISSAPHALPPTGIVQIHFRTYDGLRVIEDKLVDLDENNGDKPNLFLAANRVCSRLIEAQRQGPGIEL